MAEVYVRPNVNVEDPNNQRAAHAQKTDSRRQIRERFLICVPSDYLFILHLCW